MSMSEGLTELKYQELLEYQEVVANAAVRLVSDTSSAQVSCFMTAVLISFIMGCCTLVFAPHRNNQR